MWTGVRHENVISQLGITTRFDHSISIISEWTGMKNAHQYIQNTKIDPCPLVCFSDTTISA